MHKEFRHYIFIRTILILFIFTGCAHLQAREIKQVCFKNNCYGVELVVTPVERSRGLMFRKHLGADKGMLFVFGEEGRHSFWMKNTFIPLDIIWINKNKEVVFIQKNAQPCKEESCPAIAPSQKAKYALELNAGAVDKIGLKIGDKISL